MVKIELQSGRCHDEVGSLERPFTSVDRVAPKLFFFINLIGGSVCDLDICIILKDKGAAEKEKIAANDSYLVSIKHRVIVWINMLILAFILFISYA